MVDTVFSLKIYDLIKGVLAERTLWLRYCSVGHQRQEAGSSRLAAPRGKSTRSREGVWMGWR